MGGFVRQLINYNSPCTKGPLSPGPAILDRPGTASVGNPPDQFFFYSNNPEPVLEYDPVTGTGGLADDGFWLLKEYVYGAGRVFIWHDNQTSFPINEALVIQNPNTFDIKVTRLGAGVVPTPGTPGVRDGIDAWYSFYQGGSQSITIPAGQYGNLFARVIQPGTPTSPQIYGVVTDLIITNLDGTVRVNAFLYDLAWRVNSGGATMQALPDGTSRVRGLGSGYLIDVRLNTFYMSDILVAPQGFTIAATFDSFHGDDVPLVVDPGGGPSAPLQGCYGAQYYAMNWYAVNRETQPYTVRIYAGNSGGAGRTNCAIKTSYTSIDGGFGGCGGAFELTPGDYVPLLEETLAPDGSTYTLGFTLVTIGGWEYPLTLCIAKYPWP